MRIMCICIFTKNAHFVVKEPLKSTAGTNPLVYINKSGHITLIQNKSKPVFPRSLTESVSADLSGSPLPQHHVQDGLKHQRLMWALSGCNNPYFTIYKKLASSSANTERLTEGKVQTDPVQLCYLKKLSKGEQQSPMCHLNTPWPTMSLELSLSSG